MFDVILDERYFMLRHCDNVKMGTRTCWTIPGNAPPSEVRPHPTAIPVFPAGSIVASVGTQTGWIVLLNVTGFRSFSSAMSWLYVFESKFRCRIIALTALWMADVSVVMNWSWSPRMIRIFDRRNLNKWGKITIKLLVYMRKRNYMNLRTQWAAVRT